MSRGTLSALASRLRNIFRVQANSQCLPSALQLLSYPSPSTLVPVMEIQRSRFPVELVKIIQDVAESHFIAFDCEFSGVAGRRKPVDGGKLTLQELYHDTKEAAEKYQILQVGLTIVKEDAKKGCYVARPYNFNISPIPLVRERYFGRVWSFHSGAVDFLVRNGFQFHLPLTHGIPYLSHKEEQEVRTNWIREDDKRIEIPDMELKDRDQPLVNHIRTTVEKWQDRKKEDQAEYENIPSETRAHGVPETLNRFQMRLTHQIIRKEFPKLRTVGMSGFIRVTNPTEEQQASEKAVMERNRERDIAKAVGFRWLIDAIVGNNIDRLPHDYLLAAVSNDNEPEDGDTPLKSLLQELQAKLRTRRKVFVGHNCFTDLVYIYRNFVGDLPDRVEDFQDLIHELFPAVVDTKILATFPKKWNTSLEEVEQGLRTQAVPKIETPAEFNRYHFNESFHEAGYDSLLTAKVAIKLSAKMVREGDFASEIKETIDTRPFGIDEDDYVLAAESLSDTKNETIKSSIPTSIASTLVAPITAFKNLFQTDDADAERPPGNGPTFRVADELDVAIESQGASKTTVLAVRQKGVNWSKPHDIKKVRNALASSNIYDVLRDSMSGSSGETNDDPTSGLMSFSTSDEEKTSDAEKAMHVRAASDDKEAEKKLDALAKKGEMMPRWDDENGFWQLFGNRLQVNGSQEGVCCLSREAKPSRD